MSSAEWSRRNFLKVAAAASAAVAVPDPAISQVPAESHLPALTYLLSGRNPKADPFEKSN
ncbi:MAG: hypothetical protein DMG61_14180 [Acidobacteria bacterium]|jgi:hypothetical protein|nr:MAG: hypothetical protein DMG61_14180 [Acidobacteriota bacterium]